MQTFGVLRGEEPLERDLPNLFFLGEDHRSRRVDDLLQVKGAREALLELLEDVLRAQERHFDGLGRDAVVDVELVDLVA